MEAIGWRFVTEPSGIRILAAAGCRFHVGSSAVITSRFHLFLIAAFAAFAAATAMASPATETDAQQTQEVARWLAGSFSNRAQADRDPAFHHVLLHVQPIWLEREGEHWLYVEQALATDPNRPYRQRIYRISWNEGPVSEVFVLPGDPAAYIGAWRNTGRFGALKPEQLKLRDGCSIWLRKQLGGAYEGATRGKRCGSERSGASYATSDVVLDHATLSAWDRGFDAAGSQVWGASAGPYRFERESTP